MRSKFLNRLCGLNDCTSGNATLIVALGLPMLLGGAGLGVDLAQWYMWQRELQYAVDQAAIAGAWARADSATEATYQTRATQEFNANVEVIEGMTTAPVIALANYAGGSNNSVTVHATASRSLPFSSMLTGAQPAIYASAQASFQQGTTFTSCLIAVDPDADGAITIGGSSVLTAGCGLAALSDSDTAITVNGSPTIDAGWILSKGGIDDWLKQNTDDIIMEHMSGLYDPFADMTTPNVASANTARTYACSNGSTSTKADVGTQLTTSYSYYKGSNSNNAASYPSYTPKKSTVVGSTTTATSQVVPNGTTAGSSQSSADTWTKLSGSGQNTIWEKKTVVTTTTYSNIVVTTVPAGAYLSPGTYTDLKIKCTTVFQPGIYVLSGGTLDVSGQYSVTGAGIMIILKNGAGISINGGSNINLTAASASQLIAAGMSAADANKYAGMLIFEDRASQGNTKNKINGNASTILNGTIYMPNSGMDFMGTAGVTSQCLMIASKTINISGNANMTTFCPAGSTNSTTVATMTSEVKLVA